MLPRDIGPDYVDDREGRETSQVSLAVSRRCPLLRRVESVRKVVKDVLGRTAARLRRRSLGRAERKLNR